MDLAHVMFAVIAVVICILCFFARRGRGTTRIRSPRLGFLNLKGDAGAQMLAQDKAAFASLFSVVQDGSDIPLRADVLFIYCDINENGQIAGASAGLREIIQSSGACVVVVASENSSGACIAAAKEKGYGHANLVITLHRKDVAFSVFFSRLFTRMMKGTAMPVAWVELAPQIPGYDHADCPEAIFLPEAGQIAFELNEAGETKDAMRTRSFLRSLLVSPIVFTQWVLSGCHSSATAEEKEVSALTNLVLTSCREENETTRPIEAISAMAAIVGEQCIVAAGEYKVSDHSFVAGQRVFSDGVNMLLCGESDPPSPDSVFGMINSGLAGSPYAAQVPDPGGIFRTFAAGVGKPEDWGKVPLSLSKEYQPRRLPLRVVFDSRSAVNEILKTGSADKQKRLQICTKALIRVLLEFRDQVDSAAALKLAFETVNGMAKTAPMKESIDNPSDAMREAQHQMIKVERRKS